MSAHPESAVPPNYRYWQEEGTGWAEEYDRRKESVPLYHAEELMLADYMERSAPARVLEYGCGVGRHLRYLRELPALEVFGYEQSTSMVAECSRWASGEWIADRIHVGAPVDRLPYPDRHFDIVFTAEVLVHVRPEDLDAILSELLRVGRWQVLHLEPAPDRPVDRDTHGGCWAHDLVAAYRRLGQRCEVLPGGYAAHAPYRVLLDPSRALYTWSPVILGLLRRLERDLSRGLAAVKAQAAGLQEQLDAERGRCTALEGERGRLEGVLAAEQRAHRLDQVRLDELERRLGRRIVTERAFVRELDAALATGR